MNLGISLLLLAALGHAASRQSAVKSSSKASEAKILESKQKATNQTSKRELNFGDRKLLTNYVNAEATPAPGIDFYPEERERPLDQSRAHQIFGVRLPLTKISDVLTGLGPSFEAAVTNQLYAPVSVYQNRIAIPTSFEVPMPAASHIAYPRESNQEQNQNLQVPPRKETALPRLNFNNAPLFAVKQPKLRFHSYPQSLGPEFSRRLSIRPNNYQQPQPFKPPASPFFPVLEQPGPIRNPEHILPPQYLQQQQLYQILPNNPGYEYVNQEDNRGEKEYPNQEYQEELNGESTESPKVQGKIPVLIQHAHHAHPNGAISFARFSQNLQHNQQHDTTLQSPPEFEQPYIQQQEEQYQYQTLAPNQLTREKFLEVKQKLNYQPKYQSESKNMFVKPIPNANSKAFNPLQQHLLFHDARHFPDPKTIQLQRFPSFKPLPQSQLTAESFIQPTRTSPKAQETLPHHNQLAQPIPFEYRKLPGQHLSIMNRPLAPVSPAHHLTPLPPLKPNYSQYVQPLNPHTSTSTDLLPTTLQPLPTSTPKLQPVPDQIISSTTIQPDLKEYHGSKEQSTHSNPLPQSLTSQPPQQLEPELIHQSQNRVLPLYLESTTNQPLSTYDSQSEQLQQTTPQPQYNQKIYNSHTTPTSPRHTVVIQKQELQELFFEPSPQPSSTPQYQTQQQETLQSQQEKKSHQLVIQQHQHLLELLQQSQAHHQELQKLHSQQHRIENQQIQALRQQIAAQQISNQQYHKQQHSEPIQYQIQPQQTQKNKPEQSQQHQQKTEQIEIQQYQQNQPTQQETVQIEPQHHQTHQPNQKNPVHIELLQYQPNQQGPVQIKLQTFLQQQSNEQDATPVELVQYQHLEDQNQIPVTTPYPSQEQEKQSDHQHQPELQQQPQHQSAIDEQESLPTTLEPANNPDETFLGTPLLSPSPTNPPQIYTRSEELDDAEFASSLGVSLLPDVQYFGKYAEAIFGGLHH